MTTNVTGHDLPRLHNPLVVRRPETGLARIERDARLKRFLLIGALASFLSFMGLTAWTDNSHSSERAAATSPTIIYYQDGNGNAVSLNPPPIRTRSS